VLTAATYPQEFYNLYSITESSINTSNLLLKYYYDEEIKEDEMAGTCRTHAGKN
jgi:hypothetical protein